MTAFADAHSRPATPALTLRNHLKRWHKHSLFMLALALPGVGITGCADDPSATHSTYAATPPVTSADPSSGLSPESSPGSSQGIVEPVELRISGYRGYLGPDHSAVMGMKHLRELLADESNGRFNLTITPTEPGSRPAGQIAALQQEQLTEHVPHIMVQAATGIAGIVPEFGLLDVPFVIRTEDQADALLDGPFGAELQSRLDNKGLVGLAFWENGFRHMTSSKAPIVTADDFRGLKMRVIPAPIFTEPFEALGAETQPMPFAKLYDALATRTVDAQDNYLSQILVGELFKVQDYLSETYHSYSALVVVINKTTWEALSVAQQAMLRSAAVATADYQRELNRQQAAQARGKLTAKGMTLNSVAPSELERMYQISKPAVTRLIQDYDPAVVELFEKELGIRGD